MTERVAGLYVGTRDGREYLIRVATRIGPRTIVGVEPLTYRDGPVYSITWTGGLQVTVDRASVVRQYLDHYHARSARDVIQV